MIKFISYYDTTNENIVTCELDSDTCVGANEKVTVAIGISMKNLERTDPTSPKRIIYSMSTDADGGGMGEGLTRDL